MTQETMSQQEVRRAMGLPEPKPGPPIGGHKKAVAKHDGSKYGKRHVKGQMNRTEAEYADRLEQRRLEGDILAWWFERMTLTLAERCTFTPDFTVIRADHTVELVDVKGGGPIDPKSVVKVKVAAQEFWPFWFVVEQKQSKKLGGHWKRIEY